MDDVLYLAIHEYTAIDIDRLKQIIEHHLEDLHQFGKQLIALKEVV